MSPAKIPVLESDFSEFMAQKEFLVELLRSFKFAHSIGPDFSASKRFYSPICWDSSYG